MADVAFVLNFFQSLLDIGSEEKHAVLITIFISYKYFRNLSICAKLNFQYTFNVCQWHVDLSVRGDRPI